jgi:uncharacterized repeat protein (TIGR01451 family)
MKRLAAIGLLALAAFAAALAPSLALAQSTCSPITQGTASWTGIVNTYYPGSSATAGAGSMSIGVGSVDARGAATPVAAGDLLLIIQIQDASISSSNSTAYGGSGSGQGYTTLNSAGLFEYAVAAGPAGGSIPLATALVNTYHTGSSNGVDGQKRYQVIRVPQASSATVTGTLTAPPWNGSTGGIVAIDVAGNLNFNGQVIDVDGRGFRGGAGQSSTTDGTGAPTNVNTDYVTNIGTGTLNSSVPNGAKGEGIAGTPIIVFTQTTPNSSAAGAMTNTGGTDGTSGGYPVGSFGRGAPGNGGGGGTDGDPPANDQNTGGAGGGNYGIGGKGGFGWTPGTPPGVDGGGMGGMSVPGGTSRLFFGGGGGAGTSNNATGTPGAGLASSGASGGGIVFVRAGTTSGGGTINARGTSANTTILNDASGGGGAGGSALVFVNNNGGAVGTSINIGGGNGGCNTGGGTSTGTCTVPTGGSPHGPGGGGSGGFALLSGTATVNAAGGINGVTATSATSTQDYGSTSSSGGFQIVSLSASQIPGSGGQGSCFPQLTVTKATSTPFVAAGAPATYTITVANAANKSTATGVTLSDVLPANPNMTYASNGTITLAGGATRTAVADPSVGATSPNWGTFSIPGGGSVALTFLANTAIATAPAVYQNPANVTYLDPTRTASQTVTPGGTYLSGGTVGGSNYNSASSTAEDVTIVPAPTITKAFNPQAVAVGSTSTLTVTLSNPGTTTLTSVGLVDNYPAGMVNTAAPGGATTCGGSVTAAPGGTNFTLAGATLPSASSCTVTVNVKVTATGSYTNTIPAGALTDTQNVSTLAAGSATLYTDVTIAKSFNPNAVAPNANSTVSLVLTNPNGTAVTVANPGLTDSFPANLVAAGGAVTVTGAGCTGYAPTTLAANATSLVLTAGTIPANSSCTVSFAVKSATTGIYANTTSGLTTVETGVTGPPSNTANLGVGVINIAKAFAPANIVSGGTSTLTFTLSNPTGVAQTAGAFTDTLANMSVAANQNTGGTCTPVTALTAGQTALSFTGLAVPAAGCTITLTVTSSTVGAQNNTSGGVITALLPRGPSSNTATLNVLGKPTIAKAFSPSTILPGATSTLTFTITNPGPVGISGMSFTDTYGAGLVNASPLTVGGSCTGVVTTATAGGNTFNVTAGAIPAAASCTITVAVTAAAVGSYNNTSSGVATTDTGAAGTGSNTATLSVANPPTIAKAFGTATISQGGTSLVTFTISNGNTVPLTNLNFTDALTNMSVASPATIGGTCVGTTNSPSLVAGATALNLTVPSLAAGASCTVTVTLTSSISGTWTNTASGVTSTQTPTGGAASNTASLTVLSPPSLTKAFVPSAIQTGATSVMTFTLTNPNPSNALTNASFTDTLVNMSVSGTQAPGGTCTGITPASITGGATALTLGSSSLAAGASCTITVVVTSSVMSVATGHPNTTGTVSATETAVNPGAAATGNLIVWAPPTVTKTFSPNSIASGGTSTVTFTITNPNPGGLTNIRITDTLPGSTSNTAAQTFVGGGRGTCTGTIPTSKAAGAVSPITFSSTNLAAGASCTILMDVTSSTAGSYTNTASNILSDQTPTATTGGSDVLTVGKISVTKAFSVSTVQTNGTATLTFTITNGSGGNRTGLTFNDPFPAGMVAVGGAVTTGGTCTNLAPTTVAANATAYNLTGLDLNNNITCTLSFPVKITTAGTKSNTVTGATPAQFLNSTDTATITAYDPPTIAKAFAPATITAGGSSTLTFTLTNPNAFGALNGAAFTDTLANMAVSGAQTVGGTCVGTTPSSLANAATALSFTGITIPSGGSCTVTVLVSSSTVGVQPNTASGVTTTQTPTVGTGTGTVNLTVAGINLSKAFSPATRPVGLATTLTFTLTSTQAVAWSGLAFTDTLQSGLVVASPSNATTTCGSGTITAAPGTNAITLAGGTMASGASPCTVSVDVVSAATGTYTNNGTNLSATSPGLAFSGAAASVQYFGASTLTKAFGATSIAAGATTTLTFTLTNPAGALAVSGLGFTDSFPSGLVVAAAPGASNTCGATWAPGAGASSVTLSGGALGAGPASCTATVNVTAATLGNYVNNSSNVGALAGGLTGTGVNASLAVVGTSLTKQFNPLVVGPNSASTLTFTITNGTGNPAQSSLAFTDSLPTNLVVATPNGATNSCGGTLTAVAGSGSIALSGGALAAAQASCTLSVNVVSSQPGVYVNASSNISGATATMDTSGVNATLNVLTAPTATKAFGATFVAPGGNTSLTLTFTNVNNTAVTGLAFTDTFPTSPGAMTLFNTTTTNTCGGTLTDGAGGALNAGDTAIKLAGGTIPANGSCAITVNVAVGAAAGAYTNTIAANGITSANGGSIGAATSGTVTVPSAPTIAKSFAGPIGPGRTVTLTFTLTNPNAGTAVSGVAFSDTFPTSPAAMVVAATPNATTSGCGAPTFTPAGGAASVAFSAGTIAASGTCTVTVDVTVPSVGTYTNTTGTISATGPVALTGTTATNTLTVVQPTLAKVFAAATVDVNQTSTLTFTLTNGAGNPAQSGINFTDTLPTNVVTVSPLNITSNCPSGAGAVAALAGSGTITVTNATMASGMATCTINVDVVSAVGGTYNNTNAANLGAVAHIDTSAASATLTVRAQPLLTKAFAASSVGIGQATTLTFTVDNTVANNVARAGLSFTDTLPAGITIANPPVPTAGASCGAPAFTATNGTQPFTASGISVAAGATCTITLTVRGAALGAANNGQAQITAISGMANGVTTQTLTVVQPTAAKTFGAASINDNATTSLVFTLTNGAGNPAEAGITLGDTLPASLRFNSATPAVAYSAGCSGPTNATYTAGTRVLSGLTGIAMTAGTASCTVTVAGVTNAATATNASCAGNPAAFTNLAANVTATNATPAGSDQCLVVNTIAPNAAKTFGAASINDGAATTLVFTLTNQGSNPAQSGIALGDTLPTGLAINSATPAIAYSAGCSGPTNATYTAGTRVLSGLTGIAMTAGTASCTVTVSGVTNQATQVNASCAGNPAAFTNAAASVTTTNATNTSTAQCLVVNRANPTAAKTFGAGTIADGAATTLVFTLANSGTNPAQSPITLGDTLPTGLAINSAAPAVAYSAGCSGPTNATYTAGTRVLSGLTGIAMSAGTASCTVTVSGVTNQATQVNASCAGNPAVFTNLAANVTATNATPAGSDQCLVVTRANASAAKTFGAASINDAGTTTLVFTLTNSGTNPAQPAITLGDTLPTGLAINSASPAVAYSAGCSGPANATYTAGTRVLSGLSGIAMTAGTASCTVTVSGITNQAGQVNASCAGNPAAFTNLAANVTTTGINNGSSDQCLVVSRLNPSVAKTFGAGTIADGAATTLVFTLTNQGTNPAQSAITLGDTLPTGLAINSATPAVAYSAGCSGPTNATYTAGTRVLSGLTGIAMANGTASCTVTVSGLTNVATQVNASCAGNPAAFTNLAANVTATNATPGGSDQCLVVTRANPTVAKTFGAASINDTATTTLVFTLTNSGTNPAQSAITFGDTLPSALTLNSATPAVAYSAGCSGPTPATYTAGTRVLSGLTGIAMSAGTASCTVTVSGVTNAAGQVNASCAGNPAAFTNLAANVTATNATAGGSDQCLVVNRLNPNVAKTFGAASFNDGATTSLVFTLTNQGSNPAQSGISLGDTLPTGLAISSATPAVAYSAGCSGPTNATYTAGTRVLSGLTGIAMANGTASCTVTVSGVTNSAGQVNASCVGNPAAFTNLAANVTATGANSTSTDQCVVVNRINPTAAKTFGAGTIADGAATTVVFTLTNQGTNPAQSAITLGDTLPTGLAINSAAPSVVYSAGCSGPANAAYAAGTRVLSGLTGIAMANGTASCTVTVSGLTNTATQTNASCVGNPAAFTNLAANVTATNATPGGTDQCVVVTRANPTVAKTFGAASINDTATTTLVFTLTNSGTNPAQSAITLGDTLPTGLAINSATPAVAYSAGCSGPTNATYTAGTRALSGLTGIAMAAGTASCTVTVSGVTNSAGQVNASCAGNPAAFTNLAANVTATNATTGGTDQCLVVNHLNPNVAKTFGAASFNDGAATTLVFTLANQGSNPAQSGISVGDTLPTGLAFSSAAPAVAYSAGCSGPTNATYTAATRVLSGLTGIAMTNGTASCTVTVAGLTNAAGQVNASCAGNPAAFTNLAANVTATGANGTSTDQCVVVNRINPSAAKTFGAGTIADGAATTVVFTLTNQGTNPAQSAITLGDTLPTGLAINSAAPSVVYSAGCSGPANAAYAAGTRVLSGLTGIAMTNGTASCTVTVAGLTNQTSQVNPSCVGNPAAFTNQAASVTTTGATNASTDQCLVVTSTPPTAAKTFGAGSINDGSTTTLVFTLANGGTAPAQSGIAVGDTLPANLRLNSATPAVAYSAGCSGPANATYTAGTRVLSGLTGIAMSAGTASCTVTVSGLTNAAGQVNASCAGSPVAFTNQAASVTTTNATNVSTNQCLVVNVQSPNVAKTFGAGTIADGAATTLVFTITNQGTNPAQPGIAIGDTLPAGLALNSAAPGVAYSAGCSGPANASYNAGTHVLSGLTGIAMANGTASCTVTVSGLTNTATQTNASCAGNPAAFTNAAANVTTTASNNISTDQCLVVTRANASVAKTFAAAAINDAGTTSLVFTLTNSGTSPAQSAITIGDTLPAGLALGSATPAVAYSAGCSGPANATYTAATRVLSGLSGVAMSAGTASCTVTVAGLTNQAGQLNASCAGNPAAFTNLAASVTTTGINNGSTDQCLVVNRVNPTVAKTFGAASINDAGTTSLVFTLTNSGTNPAQPAITIGDTLPTGLVLGSATPAVAYSAGCSGPTNATYTAGTHVLSGLSGIAMANGTASCTVTVAGLTNAAGQVNASCAGSPAAFTNQAASVTATNATNASTNQCLVVNVQTPNVAKTFGAGTIADGAATTLVFTITNQGTNPAQAGIGIGDTLPTGLALSSTTPSVAYSAGCSGPANATYTAGTRVLSGLTGIAMANGTASCTVTVSGLTNAASQVNASCPAAAFTNAAASVTTTAANNTSTDQCLVVTRTNASLGKAFAPNTIDAGGTSTLVFTITNSGTNPAQSGINFTDTLPVGVAVAGTPTVQSNCPAGGAEVNNPAFVGATAGAITVTGAAMNAGVASCDVRVNVTAPAAGTFNNTNAANISGAANVTTTGVAATLTVQALPTITKAFGAANIGIGQVTTLAFTLDNTAGPVNRSGLSFSDALPAGLQVANPPAATTSAGCQAPTLTGTANASTTIGASSVGVNTGQTCVITFTVQGTTLGGKTNNAALMTVGGLANNVTPQTVTVVQPSLDKVFSPASIAASGTSTLTFTLTNGAGSPAQSGIGFTDTLPGNVRVAATPNIQTNCPAGGAFAAPGFTVTAGAGTNSIAISGASMAGAVASCQVRVDVTSAIGGAYTNDSTNISVPVNVTNAVAGTTLTVTGAAPSVAKAFAPNTIAAGATSTLTITLSNPNASTASITTPFVDTLPSGVTIASPANASTTCGGSGAVAASSGGSTVTLPTTRTLPAAVGLTPGSCTVSVDVTASLGGAYTNTIAGGALQTSNGNNASPATAVLTVNTVAPSVAKSFTPASIAANGTSTLTITLTNPDITAAGLSAALVDTLPSGVVIAATPNASTTCGGSGAVVASSGGGSVTLPATRSIPAGSSSTAGSCTVSVDVTSAVGGSYLNTIAANALQTANGNNASPASATLTVSAVAPTVAKQFTPGTVNANTPSTLTITLTNGNASAANLTAALTDTFPSPVVVAPTPNAATTCAGSGAVVASAGTNTVTLPATRSIPAAVGATPGSCTITVDVVSPVGGTFTNTIPANALQTSNGNNAAASASLTVNAVAPTIAKAFAPTTIAADGTSTVTLTISSANATALTGASFTDTLSAMSISGAQAAGGSCAGASGNNLTNGQTAVSISGLTIPAAAGATPGSCTVTFVVTSDVPGPHGNQASGVASAQAPTGSASNVATLTVTATAPTITKAFGPASIAYGATSTVTFTLSNTDGVPLTGAAFSDTLANMAVSGAQSAGGSCAGVAGNSYTNGQTGLLNFAGLTIPANGSCTVTIVVTSAQVGTWPNQASGVSSNEAPTGAASNTASLTVTATALTVSKAFAPATVNSGDVTTLTITITNPNAAAVTGLALTDTFPVTPGTGLVRAATPNASTTCASGAVSSTAGSVALSGATLGAGASCTFQIDVTAATAGTYTNTIPAGAIASSAGSNTAPATKSLTVNPLANLAVTKLGPASIATGAPINYTITVSNAGPDAANGATFADNVPAAITGVSAVCTGAAGGAACGAMNVSGNSVTSTIPTLPAGGSVSITVSGTTSGVGSVTNTATITSPAGVPDPVAANNTSSVTTNVLAPDLTITKTHSGSFTVGTNGTYTITVSNAPGSLPTSGTITVTDTLPTGLGYGSATGAGWACGFAAGTVTCTTSTSLAAGTSAPPITLTVTVASTAVPSVTNFATVSGGGEPAGTTGNNTASDNTIVVAGGVNVFQPDGAQTGMPGTVVSYPHTFNAGLAGTVSFSTSAVATPAVPGWTQTIYRDTDCNGVLNGSEGSAPLTGSIAVNAGDTICIVVRDSIPATAPYNAQNLISVTATFNGSQTITRHDTTTVGSAAGAGLVLAKTVRNVTLGSGAGTANTARPGDVLEYTITYTNTSSGAVNTIVITDATPAFTTYLSASCGAPLPGNISACAVTSQPAVNGAGSVVWTLTGSLLSSGSGSVLYQVKVAP